LNAFAKVASSPEPSLFRRFSRQRLINAGCNITPHRFSNRANCERR
jgi:hypothetical protein